MIDLRQRLSELDRLEAPDMRADIERRVLELGGSGPQQVAAREDVIAVDIGTLEPRRTGRRWPRYVIAAGAAAVLVVVIAVALFDRAGEESPTGVVDNPDLEAPEPTVPLHGVRALEASAGSLWAWGENGIWSYTDGAWAEYSPTLSPPASVASGLRDLTYDGDTLWAVTEDGVIHLDGSNWVALPVPLEWWDGYYTNVEADPGTGITWISNGEDLYRWDGEELGNVGHPQNWPDPYGGSVGQIVVTESGTVWASGFSSAWTSELGGLAHYDDTASSWEVVRPMGGDQNIPAMALATAPDGGLWALLPDWYPDWEQRQAAGQPTVEIVLAHRDGATAEWTVYDEGLPEGLPESFPLMTMAADADTVWLAPVRPGIGEGPDGVEIWGFDGYTWTHYPTTIPVTDIAVAPDGTIWVTTDTGQLRRFEP